MAGAIRVFKEATGGKIPEDMGVFGADVLKEQLEWILDDDNPARGIVGFEGSDQDTARYTACVFAKLLSNELPYHVILRHFTDITVKNAGSIITGMF